MILSRKYFEIVLVHVNWWNKLAKYLLSFSMKWSFSYLHHLRNKKKFFRAILVGWWLRMKSKNKGKLPLPVLKIIAKVARTSLIHGMIKNDRMVPLFHMSVTFNKWLFFFVLHHLKNNSINYGWNCYLLVSFEAMYFFFGGGLLLYYKPKNSICWEKKYWNCSIFSSPYGFEILLYWLILFKKTLLLWIEKNTKGKNILYFYWCFSAFTTRRKKEHHKIL